MLVSTGKSKQALGAQLFHDQVKPLLDNSVDKFYKGYEAYVGSNTTKTLIQSFFFDAWHFVKLDNVEALQMYLQDLVIDSTVSSVAGNITLRCSRLLAVANAALITVKHIDFKKELAKEPVKERSQEPCKEAD